MQELKHEQKLRIQAKQQIRRIHVSQTVGRNLGEWEKKRSKRKIRGLCLVRSDADYSQPNSQMPRSLFLSYFYSLFLNPKTCWLDSKSILGLDHFIIPNSAALSFCLFYIYVGFIVVILLRLVLRFMDFIFLYIWLVVISDWSTVVGKFWIFME
ncbi:hypothetical protein I3760_01G073000 [Carya illinoinensis]|uniref:Transmembrane protein n=1 Tax=Carya illinoinensis TaxID=32201 RepID=A0A922FWF3_CARIL|nr:hypothetical protein I3760_01G073000 [Carya illinoinensis]KAG6730354.1 hypothetical protein I3842_01G075400 [Carya illinoinensis]